MGISAARSIDHAGADFTQGSEDARLGDAHRAQAHAELVGDLLRRALLEHDAPEGEIGFVLSGKGIDYPMGQGVNGGMPGAPAFAALIEGPSDSDAPHAMSFDALSGEPRQVRWGAYRIRDGDALYLRWNGGGGYGDPLEREPERVRNDVADGTVSRDAAHDIYGVVLDDRLAVDAVATAMRREVLLERRRAEPAR